MELGEGEQSEIVSFLWGGLVIMKNNGVEKWWVYIEGKEEEEMEYLWFRSAISVRC